MKINKLMWKTHLTRLESSLLLSWAQRDPAAVEGMESLALAPVREKAGSVDVFLFRVILYTWKINSNLIAMLSGSDACGQEIHGKSGKTTPPISDNLFKLKFEISIFYLKSLFSNGDSIQSLWKLFPQSENQTAINVTGF